MMYMLFNAPYQTGEGRELFQKLSKAGYEGIIAKAPDSKYEAGNMMSRDS